MRTSLTAAVLYSVLVRVIDRRCHFRSAVNGSVVAHCLFVRPKLALHLPRWKRVRMQGQRLWWPTKRPHTVILTVVGVPSATVPPRFGMKSQPP